MKKQLFSTAILSCLLLFPVVLFAMQGGGIFEEFTACRGLMIVAIGSFAMNFFLMFRFLQIARSSNRTNKVRISAERKKGVLEHINELNRELDGEKKRFAAREEELQKEISGWKSRYEDAVKSGYRNIKP